MRPRTRDFADVDEAPERDTLLTHLDQVEALAPLVDLRRTTYGLVPGGVGVDVGCGHGRAVADLCARGVKAIGVDRSKFMVEAARRRFPGCSFFASDAGALPFPEHSLHRYRAERAYMHIEHPESALVEARRVLVPGGRVVIADPDWDSTVITSSDPALTRRIMDVFTNSLPEGRSGSRVSEALARTGFTDISVTAVPIMYTNLDVIRPFVPEPARVLAVEAGDVSTDRSSRWIADLEQRDRDHHFLLAYTMFITEAQAPSHPR